MRNFKKFLALVLAMLMVSACAVSVSAAYADQAAIDATGYADAVAALSELGIIKGDGEGFKPNDTLTRAQAAVIAAKLIAGAKGQTMDWTKATCSFADVEEKDSWAYGYIDYVAQRNIMVGDENGKFNANDELTIDQAIKIAVATADSNWAKAALKDTEDYEPAYWATYWIDQATQNGLLADVEDIFYYDVPCSRAMFAQIAYNAFLKGGNIKAGFGYNDVTATVDVAGSVVTLTDTAKTNPVDPIRVDETFFNSFLEEGVTAAMLKETESLVRYTIFTKTKTLLSVEVLTDITTIQYNDADIKIAYAYADMNKDGKVEIKDVDIDGAYIVIDDVKYAIGADVTGDDTIIGAAASVIPGIELNIDGAPISDVKGKIPTYFKANLYDNNNDGDFEICNITTYKVAYISKTAAAKAEEVDQYTVTYFGDKTGTVVNKDVKTVAKFSGLYTLADVAAVADGDTPVLVQTGVKADCTVDIIEKGAPVTGKVDAISISGKYALIDGEKYAYENDGVVVDSATRNQTVTAYLINGKLVNISANNFKAFDFIVDDVVVNEAGNVVITGFYAKDFTKGTIELNGAYEAATERYVAAAGHYEANKHDTDSKKYGKLVTLGGTKNSSGVWEKTLVTFEEGYAYTLIKNVDGYYYVGKVNKNIDAYFATLLTDGKLAVNASYIVIDGIPQYFNKNTVVITKTADADKCAADCAACADKDGKNAYGVTYKFGSAFEEATGVVAYTNAISDKKEVSFVYLTSTGTAKAETKNALAEGQSIVQILGKDYIEAGFDYFTYEAFDIIANKKVTVKTAVKLTQGEFYVVKGTDVVETTPAIWMVDGKDIRVTTTGVVTKYEAQVNTFVKSGDNWNYDVTGVKYAAYGAAQITIYETADGLVAFDADGKAKTLDITKVLVDGNLNDTSYWYNYVDNAFVVNGQIIIVK